MCKHDFKDNGEGYPVCVKCGTDAAKYCDGCRQPMEARLGFCWRCEEGQSTND